MDRSFFTDLLNDELAMNVDDNWDDAALFGPYENEQALLYQYAECLSARAFLKMCNLPFKIEQRPNAEHMSPSGEVPFLKVGRLVVADYLPIVDLVAKKGVKLSDGLTDVEIGELHAHICLLEEVLKNAEMYISWMHEPTLRVVTKRRYGSVYPWPLSSILPSLKGRQVCNKLRSFGWADRTIEQVLEEVERCCRSLSSKLGTNLYFFGESPTELDALVFGHLYTILTTELPDGELANIVKRHQNLVDFCKRIDLEYFMRSQ